MSTGDAAYNPLAYHNGTVWPHDTSIAAWGLARCARWIEAQRIVGHMTEARHARVGPCYTPRQTFLLQAIQRGLDQRVVVLDYRIPARLLIAGRRQTIQGHWIVIRRGHFLFHQTTQDARFLLVQRNRVERVGFDAAKTAQRRGTKSAIVHGFSVAVSVWGDRPASARTVPDMGCGAAGCSGFAQEVPVFKWRATCLSEPREPFSFA